MRNIYFSQEPEFRSPNEQGKVNELNAKTLFTAYWALIKTFQECSELYMKGEITLTELNHALFKKMKGSSAPGIDGFTVNWLRIFWDSLKMVTLNAINEC